MNPFEYSRPTDSRQALSEIAKGRAKFIAGGTNLVDLMRENVEKPALLVDLNHLKLREIKRDGDVLRIGALVTNSAAAYDKEVLKSHPLLADAILAGASAQLRNMATCGGNLLQRTRCYYFYDKATRCNKREPGTGCDAIKGFNRIHAVLGQSDSCIATHPSDMCVGLAALDAVVRIEGPRGEKLVPLSGFHRLPGSTPEIDTVLQADELITGIDLPPTDFTHSYAYVKVRDRSSYAFALVSAAAGLKVENGKIVRAGVAMGGVAHKPWRDLEAEKLLIGETPSRETFARFAKRFFQGAVGYEFNKFKLELGPIVLVRALTEATERNGGLK